MKSVVEDGAESLKGPRRGGNRRLLASIAFAILCLYLLTAFVIMPLFWYRYEARHPALSDVPGVTHTRSGIPGDPLNVVLIGTEEQVHRGMLAAGWYPADPITLESALRIAEGVVFKRSFDEAPVSPLYLFGRRQDLAFEKPVGGSPRERHHVRFWKAEKTDAGGAPVWVGSATFDTRVGIARDTGQITHHISPNVDADRDLLMQDLKSAGTITSVEWLDSFHKVSTGRNGEGDPWHTDCRLAIGYLATTGPSSTTTQPDLKMNPESQAASRPRSNQSSEYES